MSITHDIWKYQLSPILSQCVCVSVCMCLTWNTESIRSKRLKCIVLWQYNHWWSLWSTEMSEPYMFGYLWCKYWKLEKYIKWYERERRLTCILMLQVDGINIESAMQRAAVLHPVTTHKIVCIVHSRWTEIKVDILHLYICLYLKWRSHSCTGLLNHMKRNELFFSLFMLVVFSFFE